MIHGADGPLSLSDSPAPTDGHASYQGSLIIAMPGLSDPSFAHAVIYLCRHDAEHAMGLILNQPISGLDFSVMLRELGIPAGVTLGNPQLSNQKVYRGGPVQGDRGFVLHSLDYRLHEATLDLSALAEDGDGVGLTASRDILVDLSKGEGPAQTLIVLGYAGWGPGQLESEMAHNAWIVAPATHELLFGGDPDHLWNRALASLGIEPGHLSGMAGNA